MIADHDVAQESGRDLPRNRPRQAIAGARRARHFHDLAQSQAWPPQPDPDATVSPSERPADEEGLGQSAQANCQRTSPSAPPV